MLTIYVILISIILILLCYLYIVYYKYNIKKEINNLKDHILKLDNAFISQKDGYKKMEGDITCLYDEIKLIFNEIDTISIKQTNLNIIKKLSKEYDELRTLVSDNHILIKMELKDINNKIFKNIISKGQPLNL